MKYNLEIGEIVYFKCRVIGIYDNCVVHVTGVNVGDKNIIFSTHPNSLKKYEDKKELVDNKK